MVVFAPSFGLGASASWCRVSCCVEHLLVMQGAWMDELEELRERWHRVPFSPPVAAPCRGLVVEGDASDAELAAELRDKEEDPEDLENDPERELEPPDDERLVAALVAQSEADVVEARRFRRVRQIESLRETVEATMPGWWDRHTGGLEFAWALCRCNLEDVASVRDLLLLVQQSHECEGGRVEGVPDCFACSRLP
jgi:hypothetical protein